MEAGDVVRLHGLEKASLNGLLAATGFETFRHPTIITAVWFIQQPHKRAPYFYASGVLVVLWDR